MSENLADNIRSDIRGRIAVVLFFLAILALYGATLAFLYPNMPVLAHQAENIPGYGDHYPPFRVDEYNYRTIAGNILNGSIYEPDSLEQSYTMGFPVVAAPFVALFGDMGGYVANVLIMWGCLILFYLMLRRYFPRLKSSVVTFLLGFVTLNWFYATSGYTEPLAQLLLVASLFMVTNDRSGRRTLPYFISGVLVALNLFVRPHYILAVAPMAVYIALNKRLKIHVSGSFRMFGAGVLCVGILWNIRNVAVFDGPFVFEYSRLMASYVPGASSGYMKGNIFLGSHRLLFDQYHGLFTITPILLLFPAGLRSMWLKEQRRIVVLLFGIVVVMAVFASCSAYPFTDFGLGSRHMLPLMPLMMLPVAWFIDGRVFARSLVTFLALYSFYHAGIGWFTGAEPGTGYFIGILNASQSRAVLLARKGALPKRTFESRDELVSAFVEALREVNMYKLLQTLDPVVIEKIRGNERKFLMFLISRKNPVDYIYTADPRRGIVVRSFSLSEELQKDAAAIQGSLTTE